MPSMPRRFPFVVFRGDAVVADERVGHGDDLAAVRGVGEDLLITGHGGIEAGFTGGGTGDAEGFTEKMDSVFEGENGFHAGLGRALDGALGVGNPEGWWRE
jgi:hypothetical protein